MTHELADRYAPRAYRLNQALPDLDGHAVYQTVEMWHCRDCGALVISQGEHDAFHERVDA